MLNYCVMKLVADTNAGTDPTENIRLSAILIIDGDFQTPARHAHLSSNLVLCAGMCLL